MQIHEGIKDNKGGCIQSSHFLRSISPPAPPPKKPLLHLEWKLACFCSTKNLWNILPHTKIILGKLAPTCSLSAILSLPLVIPPRCTLLGTQRSQGFEWRKVLQDGRQSTTHGLGMMGFPPKFLTPNCDQQGCLLQAQQCQINPIKPCL